MREARAKTSPLHTYFEWDNGKAGEKWREHQASELIRSVKIQYVKGRTTKETRHFVSVNRPDDGYSYMPAEDVAKDEILTAIVLREMEREWKVLKERYGHFREFVEMVRRDVDAA